MGRQLVLDTANTYLFDWVDLVKQPLTKIIADKKYIKTRDNYKEIYKQTDELFILINVFLWVVLTV